MNERTSIASEKYATRNHQQRCTTTTTTLALHYYMTAATTLFAVSTELLCFHSPDWVIYFYCSLLTAPNLKKSSVRVVCWPYEHSLFAMLRRRLPGNAIGCSVRTVGLSVVRSSQDVGYYQPAALSTTPYSE